MAKTKFQGLIYDRFKLPGARFEETRDLNIIKPNSRGLESKTTLPGRRVLFPKRSGSKTKIKGLKPNYF